MRAMFLFFLIPVLGYLPASATTLHVPVDHHQIQWALDAAEEGDTVLVAPGIYSGPACRNLDFGGKALLLISSDGPAATIIDCEGAGRGFRFDKGEDERALLRGFTILNAAALGCGSEGKGAGVYCANASPRIEACLFKGGIANYGGALALEWDADPFIDFCLFRENIALEEGGAFYFSAARGLLRRCYLMDNHSAGLGSDAMIVHATPEFEDCHFESEPDVCGSRLRSAR
jgi:hypothetical protein